MKQEKVPWLGLFILATLAASVFDILRKTVFLGAEWNYQYPPWEFVYDPVALVLLVLVGLAVIFSFERLNKISNRQFILALYISTIVVSVLALFATPAKAQKWAFQPHLAGPIETFQYKTATIAAEDGIQAFFANFHSAPTLSGTDRLETTRYLTEQLQQAEFLPWNDELANYASNIVTQRHGPIPSLLIAPFLFILGTSPTNAVIGSYVITVALPVITYFILRPYFDQRRTRFGTLLVLFTPAYLIYQRYGTVSYDAITSVVIAVAVFLFLKACRTQRRSHLALSGIAFSAAMLSKISILTLFSTFFILIFVYSDDIKEFTTSIFVFGLSTLLLPLSLLPLGYNFFVQYLYDIARIQMSGGDTGVLLAWALSVYNTRLVGIVILGFALLFIITLLNRLPAISQEDRSVIALAFIPSLLPFALLKGITLSRHLLPLLPLLIFIGLVGMERTLDRSLNNWEIGGVLVSTFLLALINI